MRVTGAGELAWAHQLGDGASFTGLARDADGNLLCSGGFEEQIFLGLVPEGRRDGVLALYDDAGNQLWLRHFPSPEWLNLSACWPLPDGQIGLLGEASGPATIGLPNGALQVEVDDVLFMLRLR
jgi:hypothetical protein